MKFWKITFLATTILATCSVAQAGQAPGALASPDVPISHHDRVYAAEQFSNTVSVTDPVDNKLLGVIRLGDPQPGNFSPLYKGQVLVHGMGYSPDHRTLAVVSIGSNSVTFIDTATNAVKHVTYIGRSPHEAFFTPDGKEVWVTVRGENYISVLDPNSFEDHDSKRPGHADFLAGRQVRLYLLVVQSGDRRGFGGRAQDHRKGEAGEPVLSEYRGDAGGRPGLVHAQGYRQDPGVQRQAAVQSDQDHRYRPDHQSR
jgi:YVTN family beta-propeller protein